MKPYYLTMNRHLLRLLLLLPLAWAASCSDTSDDNSADGPGGERNVNRNDATLEPSLARLEFPQVKGGHSKVLIYYNTDAFGINYSVEWDCDKKSQRWSCYQLNSAMLEKNTGRYSSNTDQYPADPQLEAAYTVGTDLIYGSGFDHGHICPSADRLYSYEANKQTFYLTNMQPQYKAFNGSLSGGETYKNNWSPWFQLESRVRSWASETNTEMLYVVKGGTIEEDQLLSKIKGQLPVPKYFFVALLLKNKSGYKAIGFWMEHKGSYTSQQSLADCAVSIRTLEQKTGIDFFCNLPDETEEHVETLPVENLKKAWKL